MFRPQEWNGKFKLKHRGKIGQYHWTQRRSFSIKTYLQHVGGVLHYRSSHAPLNIRKKWKAVAKNFEAKYRKSV